MQEIELKFSVADFRAIRSKLKKIGGKLVWKGTEQNFFFDTPTLDLRRKKHTLRLREWPPKSASITVKAPPIKQSQKYSIRSEYQIEIDNATLGTQILKRIGFVQWLHYTKHREHWKLKNAAVELDKINGRFFVEIEAPQKTIEKMAQTLGLDWQKRTTKGYLDILQEA
ncbi:class IV adenylate cyclase [Candidatus Peregrinibacteria bacterium]|nr:class IV adenylate cyclase [Candidatus Peregrinibacteria bacterium]MBI5732859.1 class IV adenylate cyclase [Candidatus Jorgensenbacteria bacterium]